MSISLESYMNFCLENNLEAKCGSSLVLFKKYTSMGSNEEHLLRSEMNKLTKEYCALSGEQRDGERGDEIRSLMKNKRDKIKLLSDQKIIDKIGKENFESIKSYKV